MMINMTNTVIIARYFIDHITIPLAGHAY